MANIKLQRAQRLAGIAGMPVTSAAVMAALNTEAAALVNCTSKQLGAVLRLIQSQFNAGRASTGAEIIDGDCVWIGAGVNKLIPLTQLRSLTVDLSD